MIDNHIHHGNDLRHRRAPHHVEARTVDMNDRALRDITVGLGGRGGTGTRARTGSTSPPWPPR